MVQDTNPSDLFFMGASTEEVTRQSRKVAVELRSALVKGTFQPGEPLREMTLGNQFHTTRAAVREALKELVGEGIVQHIPNKGFIASTVTLADAEDVYQAREVLEGQASRLFTERATVDQVVQLEEATVAFEEATKHPQRKEALLATKNHFYDVLLDGCGNKVIHDLLISLRDRISWLRAQTLSHPGRPSRTLEELQAILAAVKLENPKEAEEASKKHVRQAAKVAYNILRARDRPLA